MILESFFLVQVFREEEYGGESMGKQTENGCESEKQFYFFQVLHQIYNETGIFFFLKGLLIQLGKP